MGMENYSKHQQKIIKRYYENVDQISLQRLGELVTDLYLSEGKKRDKVWLSIVNMMEKLKVPPTRIAHLRTTDDPKLIAALVTELTGKVGT